MKNSQNLAKAAQVLAGAWLIVSLAAGCNRAAAPSGAKPAVAAVKPKTPVPAASTNGDSYASVFEDLPAPKGRDPFYPDSHRREPVPPPTVVAHNTTVASDLLLKGIVGSATHRLAVINSEILAVGEESAVRVPNGQVHVRCLEIGDDYVVIKVDGEARPKRLELNKK
ncbi:MAG TPA: hypothetical protein VMR33_17305 [Candidatus Baltobacteraceae bacterium]|jgi:hypothetical protein|nr:hypothetical protein [Candidatus Baltobacteraceae bacterium]